MADNPDMVDKRIADNNSNITINSNLNNNSSSNENNNKDNNNSSNNNSNNHSNNQNNPYHDKRNKIDGDGDGENASERSPLLSSLIISDEEEVKDNIPSLWYWRNWGALFLLGTINNLAYVVVNSSAQSLANSFNEASLIALVPWANVALGFVVRGLNTFALEGRVKENYRMIANGSILLIGLISLTISTYISFWLCLISIVLIGSSSSFGESVLLGYIREYPSSLIDGWGSGTGMSGVVGSLLYLLLQTIGLSNTYTYLLLAPTAVVYLLVWWCLMTSPNAQYRAIEEKREGEKRRQKESDERVSSSHSKQSQQPFPLNSSSDHVTTSVQSPFSISTALSSQSDEEYDEFHDEIGSEVSPLEKSRDEGAEAVELDQSCGGGDLPQQSSSTSGQQKQFIASLKVWLSKQKRCLQLVWWMTMQLTLVYMFEYIVSTGDAAYAEYSNYANSSNPFVERNSYAILSLCYQLGTLVSRSSLKVVRIRWVEVLTVLQALNVVLWTMNDYYKFMSPYYAVQFALMFYVGLLGGASYVNCFYNILHDPNIEEDDRELCVNFAALGITLGITMASFTNLLFDNTFLKDK